MQQILRACAIALTLASLCLITGCGNKGALFIPEPPAEAQSADVLAQ